MSRRHKRRRVGLVVLVIVLLVILALLIGACIYIFLNRDTLGDSGVTSASSTTSDVFDFTYAGSNSSGENLSADSAASSDSSGNSSGYEIKDSGIMSTNAEMYSLTDDEVLFDKASTDKIYPASLTKIMTVYCAIKNVQNLDESVTVTQENIDPGYTNGLTQAGFEAGETVTLKDLLYGAILPSGSDACYAIARTVSGSTDEFINLMNSTAQELGMNNTNFTNCTGMQDENHYTTIADMVLLVKTALEDDNFKTIFTTSSYTTTATSQHPSGITLTGRVSQYFGENMSLKNGITIKGGKTGFTSEAGYCMATLAEGSDGKEYILVTAHAFSEQNAKGENIYDYPNAIDALILYYQIPDQNGDVISFDPLTLASADPNATADSDSSSSSEVSADSGQ